MEVAPRPSLRWLALIIVGVLTLDVGCRSSKSMRNERTVTESAPLDASTDPPQVNAKPRDAVSTIALLDYLPTCDIEHNGLMLDLGVATSASTRDYGMDVTEPVQEEQVIDRAGSTFLPVNERRLRREFWLDEPTDALTIRVRVAGRGATALTLWVDGRRLGRVKLLRNEISVVNFPRFPDHLEAGRHVWMLEAHGRPTNPSEPWFEVDWLQFRRGSELDLDDTAPTRRDIVADQEIDGVPRRSIVLRAASKVHCPFHLSGKTELHLDLGYWGSGRGTAEIRLIEEGQPPITLNERRIAGGNGARWTPLTLDLSPYAGRVVALELRAVSASQGGRVVFGEPRLTRSAPATSAPIKAKNVILVIAAGLERRLVPPWGPIADRGALADLRRDSLAFDNYRASTTVPSGVVATLLTGVSPMVHKVEDTAARLTRSTRTLSEVIKQAGGRTAMFTGVPSTFAAFGFNVSWDEYASFSPVLDLPAETPLSEGARWLARELDHSDGPMRFLLIHARGAHPPWDLTKEQTTQLEPQDYGGPLDARRAGITLGRIRRQTTKVQRRLSDEDTVRLRALMGAAFSRQVAALGQLIETLKRRNAWNDTLFVFAGDIANGDTSVVPFDPVGNLREDQLLVPLLIKFPGRLHAGESFTGTVTTADVTRTILEVLGLSVSEPIEGAQLIDLVDGVQSPQSRTLVATLGKRFASRTGVWLLSGELGRPPRLCQMDVDPMCVEDHYGQQPYTARSLWQWTATELSRIQRVARSNHREPASIDPETAAALTVWGDVEM